MVTTKTLRNSTNLSELGIMEKVWEELKKIEARAEQIRSEAQDKAKMINVLAQQKAQELIANSKTYAQEEAQQLVNNIVQEANGYRDVQLKANQEATEKLRAQAEKRMEQAAAKVVSTVLGENKF